MSQVPIRQPRFLGEKVPTREQSVQEKIQAGLGSGYTVESSNGGYVARASPIQYVAERRGAQRKMGTYIPHEYFIDESGNVVREVKRETYKSGVFNSGQRREIYESEVTDYKSQTQKIYSTRSLKSGRQSIKLQSKTEGGRVKEYRIIDQDSAEYERTKRTPEQARLIREKGFLVKNTDQYKVAGLPQEQRREYYKQVAKQKTAQHSLEGRAVTLRNQAQRDYERELSVSAQKYATDIRVKQNALSRTKPPLLQKPAPVVIQPGPGIIPEPTNPASPTTRTDMGTQLPAFFLDGKLPAKKLQEAEKSSGLQEKYNRAQDQLSFKQSRARQSDQALAVVGIGAGKFALGIPAGAVNVVRAVMPWNLPDTVGSMVNPESYRELGVQLATDPTKTAGEIVGAVATGYGIGKGIQYGKAKIKAYTTPKDLGGPSSSGGSSSKTVSQSRLQTYDSKNYPGQAQPDIKGNSALKSAQIPDGKGARIGTVFSSKKVVNAKGKIVRTPAIEVTGHRIPGDPTRLGTRYEGYFTEKGELAGYKTSPPVRVRPEVQQPLITPQITAQSKTFSWDKRAVVVKGGQPYVKDLFGQGPLRKVQPGEFYLRTVYPDRPGPTPSQSNFLSGGGQTVSGIEFRLKGPGSGTQTTLGVKPPAKPIKITIVKDPAGGFTQTYGPKVLTEPSVAPQSQTAVQVVKKAPQTYATAGEVLKGTLKVEPRYSLSNKGASQVKLDLPDYAPTPVSPVPKTGALVGGLIGLSSYQPISQPQGTPQVSLASPRSVAISKTPQVVKPAIKVITESLGAYDQKAITTPDTSQIPVLLPASATTLRTELATETALRTELITEPIFEPVYDTPPTTGRGGGVGEPIKEVPPRIIKLRVGPKEETKQPKQFKVQVREKGVFKDFKTASDIKTAFTIGKQRVLSDETASFRIRSGDSNVMGGFNLGPMFRESKKEPGVFIEKRKFRIDTPGEKRKITFKGLQIIKVKSIFKKRGR